MRVLDLGAGTGLACEPIKQAIAQLQPVSSTAPLEVEVVGVDLSEKMLLRAKVPGSASRYPNADWLKQSNNKYYYDASRGRIAAVIPNWWRKRRWLTYKRIRIVLSRTGLTEQSEVKAAVAVAVAVAVAAVSTAKNKSAELKLHQRQSRYT